MRSHSHLRYDPGSRPTATPVRGRTPRRVVTGLLAGMVLAGCATSGSRSPGTAGKAEGSATASASATVSAKAAAGPRTVPVGQTLTVLASLDSSSADITLSGTKTTGKLGEYDVSEKGEYLLVDVAVVGRKGSFSASPSYFRFLTADGTVYEAEITVAQQWQGVDSLQPGQKTGGKMAFDIPKGASKGGKFELLDLTLKGTSPAAFWTV